MLHKLLLYTSQDEHKTAGNALMGENKTEATTETLKSALVAVLTFISQFPSFRLAFQFSLLKAIRK